MNAPNGPARRGDGGQIPLELVLAFAPLHKRAFGSAFGAVTGTLVASATLVAIIRPEVAEIVGLLANYFPGYSVSVLGAVVGFAWAVFSGFVFGWFAAFSRNFVIACSIWLGRVKSEMEATRDFLDHI